MLDYIVLDCYTCILFDWYNNNDYYCWLRYERDNNICYCFACRNWITIYIWTGAIGLVVWSVAFTDDGWRANLHGLHLVYDLILFCFSCLFLVFWHLSFGFSMVSGSCQLCLSISLVYIWEYYQFIWDLSALFRSYQLCFICSSFHHIDFGFIVSIYILILGPLCPSIFPILGPNVPICTSLSDSALQFRPGLAIMQCLIISF